jgi:type III pantothenate kinase
MNPFLVIDVGNTSTKCGVVFRNRIIRQIEIPTSTFKEKKSKSRRIFHLKTFDLRQIEGAIICSVVPKAIAGLKKELSQWGVQKPIVVSHKMQLGIGIRYPKPQTIGPDRLVNSVAAVSLYGSPAVVVDFGTAVTFDVISNENEYLGGVIAPGLRAMTNYLYEQTALLPQISLKETLSPIGKNTVEAMRVGAVIGYRGLIREILYAVANKMKWKLAADSLRTQGRSGGKGRASMEIKVIATGGHSSLIASKVPEIHFVNQQLTLEGLRIIYQQAAATSR